MPSEPKLSKPTSSSKPAPTRWAKGTSGNPAGRPLGSRNKSTLLLESMVEGEIQALGRKAIERGLEGDTAALRLCLDRIAPRRKESFIEFPLPEITNPKEAAQATGLILKGLSEGQITPSESDALLRAVGAHVQVLDIDHLERRIAELERTLVEERELRPGQPGWLTQKLERSGQAQLQADPGNQMEDDTEHETETQPEAETQPAPVAGTAENGSPAAPNATPARPNSSWMDWKPKEAA